MYLSGRLADRPWTPRFVATAWTRKTRLDEVDIDKAHDFGVALTGKGPESVACPLN